MNFAATQRVRYSRHASGFTLVEGLVASVLAVMVVGVFAVLAAGGGRTIESITSQISHNQTAGNGTELMIGKIRLANSVKVDGAGETLTLSFDDNPDVDSNGDKIVWNDQDHFEEFKLVDADKNPATLDDNIVTYKANINDATAITIVPQGTSKLGALPIFAITNTASVFINFGLLTTNRTPFSQLIEIRTRAVARNHTK